MELASTVRNCGGGVSQINEMSFQQEQIDLAISIAKQAHEGQFRRGGKPYFSHVSAVANLLSVSGHSWDIVSAGYLHDVVEDTNYTIDQLADLGVDWRVLLLIEVLTHKKGQSYEEYIIRIQSSSSAVKKIKIADIIHNLSSSPTERQVRKYARALEILNFGITV